MGRFFSFLCWLSFNVLVFGASAEQTANQSTDQTTKQTADEQPVFAESSVLQSSRYIFTEYNVYEFRPENVPSRGWTTRLYSHHRTGKNRTTCLGDIVSVNRYADSSHFGVRPTEFWASFGAPGLFSIAVAKGKLTIDDGKDIHIEERLAAVCEGHSIPVTSEVTPVPADTKPLTNIDTH